jgi:hypothetical protein
MRYKVCLFVLACALVHCVQGKPVLSFFNELKGPELKTLFADTTLIPTLQQLHAEIRMGMLDLSPERAEVLKKLNDANIPVVAWLLLPEEKGYWFHSGNGDEAIARYKEIKQWADQQGIRFKGIGLDLELDMNDLKLFKASPWALVRKLPARLYDAKSIENGRAVYNQLLQLIREDGYPIESYYASFVKDETEHGTTSIQRLTKFLDVPTEKEIPMLYTSFMGNADGFLKVYALEPHLKYVALGSTGGGVDTTMHTLSWDDLAHDLRMVGPVAVEIHIFSLEGTVKKGFMPRLVNFDYTPVPEIHEDQVKTVQNIRSNILTISKILSYPTLLFLGITLLVMLIGWGLYLLGVGVYRLVSRLRSSR